MKKIISILLVILTLFAFSSFAVACGEEESNNVNYTVMVTDGSGNVISGVQLEFKKGGSVKTASTDELGKATASLVVGNYSVSVISAPSGYADAIGGSIAVSVSKSSSTFNIVLLTVVGSEDEPIAYEADSLGAMTVTLPAKTIHYYVVYRSRGRVMTFAGTGYSVDFNGQTYDINGTCDITLNGTSLDTFSFSIYCVKNLGNEPTTISMLLSALPEDEVAEEE